MRIQPGPRSVVFVKYHDKASSILGADQVSRGLRRRGVAARVATPRGLDGVRHSLVVFIKKADLGDLLRLVARDNLVVLDVQDTICHKRGIKFAALYDGVIFKNGRQWRDFGREGRRDAVIYHQWDPRLRLHRVAPGQLRVAYVGDPRSCDPAELPAGIAFVDTVADPCYHARLAEFNVHVSPRNDRRELRYKPNCKISTAAATGAVLVTTPDESSLELLGEGYPFYAAPGPQGLAAALERVRACHGGPHWHEALARLWRVRERTSIGRVLDDYEVYLGGFGPLPVWLPPVRRPLRSGRAETPATPAG